MFIVSVGSFRRVMATALLKVSAQTDSSVSCNKYIFFIVIVQKNLLFRKGIGIRNFSGPSSYSFNRDRNYSFTLIPLKGTEY